MTTKLHLVTTYGRLRSRRNAYRRQLVDISVADHLMEKVYGFYVRKIKATILIDIMKFEILFVQK